MHHRVITIIMRNIVGHIYDLYTLPQSTTLCHIYYIIAAAGSRKQEEGYAHIPLYTPVCHSKNVLWARISCSAY